MDFKKTFNIFGRAVPISALALLAMAGIGSAALVGYISNQVQAGVTVTSPMEQFIGLSVDNYNEGPLSILAEGGETKTFYVITKNLADVSITGAPSNIVTNAGGVACADFTSVIVYTSSNGGTWDGPYNLIALGLCYQVDSGTVKFSYGLGTSTTWAAGQTDVTQIAATFKPNALGTYTFTSQILV